MAGIPRDVIATDALSVIMLLRKKKKPASTRRAKATVWLFPGNKKCCQLKPREVL